MDVSVKAGFHLLLLLLFILIYLPGNPYTSAPYPALSSSHTEYIEKLNAFAMLFLWWAKLIDFAVTATVIENIC